tara:strand:+ start:610 stop:1668 length:1059 start_codon:yes stop_codon:yes gene_type:complete
MMAIAISLLVIGISRSYKNNIELEISKIEADLNVYHSSNNYISSKDIEQFIDSILIDSIPHAKYISYPAMLKRKNRSKGIYLYGIDKVALNKIFNLNYINEYNENDDFLYLSNSLYEDLSIAVNEEIYIFNIDKMIKDKIINGIKVQASGVYDSNIKTFDEKVVFTSIDKARELMALEDTLYTGLMIEGINSDDIDKSKSAGLIYETWEEKHSNLLNWLMIFSNPIKLILLFILILAIIYKVFTFWLILYDRSLTLDYFKVLGISNRFINKISFNIIIILSLFSMISGSLLALLISYIQNKYQLVTVDSSIYILSKINSTIFITDILYLLLGSLFVLILFSRITTYFRFRKL